MENHEMSALAPNSRQCMPVLKSSSCRTDLLSSPEMMGVRGYHDISCIPPVPSVVKNSAYPNMESKIPKPSNVSKAPVKESWRLGDDSGIESPKGMDPCRFASIKGKFEAMHKRASEASPSPLGSGLPNHSLPAARVQRIAESLARLEKVFPEAETSGQSTASIPCKDKVVNPAKQKLQATTKTSRSLMQKTGCKRANEAGKSKTGKVSGLGAGQLSAKSTNMHTSVSSLNQAESAYGPPPDQYKSSLESQNSSSEYTNFSRAVEAVESSITMKACDGNQSLWRPSVVDTAFTSARDEKQKSGLVTTLEEHSASLNDSAENERWQNGCTLLTEDRITITPEHRLDTIERDSQSTPSEQITSSVTSSRGTSPCPRTFSAGCATETRRAGRSSSSRLGHSYIGSFDSVWSMELSEPLSVRLPPIDAQYEQCSACSTRDGASPIDQEVMKALSDCSDSHISASFCTKSTLDQTVDRNVRTPIEDSNGTLLEAAELQEIQDNELSRMRVLQWNSAPDLDVPHIYGSNPVFNSAAKDRSSQQTLTTVNLPMTSTSTCDALLTTSEVSSRNVGRRVMLDGEEEMRISGAKVPRRITAAPKTIVAPSHLRDVGRFCQSLGSMGDIRVPNGGLAQQHSSDNPSRVSQPRSDRRARSFAMCDFIFVSPDPSLLSATRVDGSLVHTDELQSPRMEDSASTVICGTPLTSRTPRLTRKRKLYGRLVSIMKLVLPGKRKSKKALGTKKCVTFKDQVDPKTPVGGGCLPRRFTMICKTDSHSGSGKNFEDGKGKKTWWKPSQHIEESIGANDAASHNPDSVRNSDSSVHKYSRRHMFLMDKIENERLGSSTPAHYRGRRDKDPAWLHGLKTS